MAAFVRMGMLLRQTFSCLDVKDDQPGTFEKQRQDPTQHIRLECKTQPAKTILSYF